jgi:hypothetical protein
MQRPGAPRRRAGPLAEDSVRGASPRPDLPTFPFPPSPFPPYRARRCAPAGPAVPGCFADRAAGPAGPVVPCDRAHPDGADPGGTGRSRAPAHAARSDGQAAPARDCPRDSSRRPAHRNLDVPSVVHLCSSWPSQVGSTPARNRVNNPINPSESRSPFARGRAVPRAASAAAARNPARGRARGA